MIRGFYTAASGLVSHQVKMDSTANNIANINTTGFKPQQVEFSSLLYTNINGGAANYISVGHGTKPEKTNIDFSQGDPQRTDMPLDFTILGDGFFALESAETNDLRYTRDGSFRILTDGKKSYLTDASGNYVLDSQNRRIEHGEKFDCGQIGVFNFKNPYGLVAIGSNQYRQSESSGEAENIKSPEILSGYLESSAVETAMEMVRMIEASKGFTFNSRVLQTVDEMERIINQLR